MVRYWKTYLTFSCILPHFTKSWQFLARSYNFLLGISMVTNCIINLICCMRNYYAGMSSNWISAKWHTDIVMSSIASHTVYKCTYSMQSCLLMWAPYTSIIRTVSWHYNTIIIYEPTVVILVSCQTLGQVCMYYTCTYAPPIISVCTISI